MNEDLKEKMRKALEAKKGRGQGAGEDAPLHEKVHGPEVAGSTGPQMHRRKAGGGGA